MLKSFFDQMFKNENSGQIARNRLKVVIMQDRMTFSPVIMEKLKKDILEVFARYLEIEEEGLEFHLEKEKNDVGLSISIPIKDIKQGLDLKDEE